MILEKDICSKSIQWKRYLHEKLHLHLQDTQKSLCSFERGVESVISCGGSLGGENIFSLKLVAL